MNPVRVSPERRAFPRHRIRVAVLWSKRPREVMAGEICDVSKQGVFLISRTALPDDVGIGVRTRITLRTDDGEESLVGMVRWRGYHPMHEAIGCGIQLDEESRAVVLRLFPQLLEDK
jgi:hypothetical protein